MTKKRIFGELELAILQMFRSGKKMTVRNVLEALETSDKYTTIMTVMNRMVEKGLLNRQRIGQHYEYWINDSKKIHPQSFLDKIKEKVFNGKLASMVSYLIESGEEISDKELNAMEQMIKELRKTRKQ